MTSNTYSAANMASFLESMLWALGREKTDVRAMSRSETKKLLRELERECQGVLKVGSASVAQPADGCASFSSMLIREKSRAIWECVTQSDLYAIDGLAPVGCESPPFLGGVQSTKLDVALRIGRDGPVSFFESVLAYWARRHEVAPKTSSPDKRPRRRRAVDRLFLALMRFVFGFFGSHKVDARNTP